MWTKPVRRTATYWSILIVATIFLSCQPAPGLFQNRLAQSSSPYLREHADNPVDWYEWGDEAITKAKRENKPLLVSIGYAACHWCHEMEKESFMDTAVARLMNENFVCIKVDKEERPDIDNLFIHACQLLNNGEAGWPLNAFALPDGKPFFAGTYYTKSNWIALLTQVADTYKNKYNKVVLQANSLTFGIIDNDSLLINPGTSTLLTKQHYDSVYNSLVLQLDRSNGGLTGNQKFPVPPIWDFLLQHYYFTNDSNALEAVTNTLNKMALGGIYDHLAGGFSRYATDSLWRVPHFEKMLYDNAQLVSLYTHAFQVTKDPFYKQIALETIAFIQADLGSANGGFYCSLNADTEQGEGAFYRWNAAEVLTSLDNSEGPIMQSYFHIGVGGSVDNILYATHTPAGFARANNMREDAFENILRSAKAKLLAVRSKRPAPSVDDKMLTSWNALMMQALMDAYSAFGEKSLLDAALKNAAFLSENMMNDQGHLWRNYHNGKTSVDAFLDDYALLASGFVNLYQINFDTKWLKLADKLVDYASRHFYDAGSGFYFFNEKGAGDLPVRKIELVNNIMPPSNAVMADVLYKLGILLDSSEYIVLADKMVQAMSRNMMAYASNAPNWLSLMGQRVFGTHEIAIMGPQAGDLNSELQRHYLPGCLFAGGNKEDLPILESKLPTSGTLVYVCTNRSCRRPVNDAGQALEQLGNALPAK